jgi:hypothetical protein
MNVAGKSLQDIYDAGSKRLSELEEAQKKQMGESADTHLDGRKEAEPQAVKQLQERSADLEQEISGYLAQGLDRVIKSVGAETIQTEKFIQRLVDGLDLLSKKFVESIAQLRDAAETQLTDLSSDHEHLYNSACVAASSRLKHQGTQLVDECRNEGSQTHSDLLTCVDQAWQSILTREDEVVAEVLSNFEGHAGHLSNKLQDCQKTVEGDVSAKLSKLELRAMEATEAVRSAVDRSIEKADKHAFDADVKLKERFSSLLYETTSSIEDSSQRVVTDLAQLHESSMADLTMRSQELSREMDSLVADIAGGAENKRKQMRDKGSHLISDYTNELNDRRSSTETFRSSLERERLGMIGEIWSELGQVKEGFEGKLAALAKGTLEKMRAICEESESAIGHAQSACASESKQYAAEKQKAIEQLCSEFVARVNSTRDHALDAISKASGSGAEETKESDAEDSKEAPQSDAPQSEAPQSEASQPEASAEGGGAEDEDSASNASGETRKRRRPGRQSDKRGEGKQ